MMYVGAPCQGIQEEAKRPLAVSNRTDDDIPEGP